MDTRERRQGASGGGTASAEGLLPPGTRLGPHRIDRFVARGGMASVFAAVDERTGEEVALKLLREGVLDTSARGRFRREFRALSRLDHPNVLRVREWGLWEGRPWFSMELVEGRALRDEVEAWAGLEPADRFTRVQGVLVQVARALDYLHERGLVHRDLTPGNVMVRPDGVVKVMDFGVVREMGSELTGTREVMGTAAWIAPEQIEGRQVDARADLYSLGAMLYFLLTGRRPFQARSVQGFLDKHLHERPRPPREVDPRVPRLLDRICTRLLEKDPADRFASAAHLLHVLGDVEPSTDDDSWPPRLVGRAGVRARLRTRIDQVTAGAAGEVVLIQGHPGQGKTRVLDTAEALARRRGLRVVRSRARPDAGPFGVFVPVLRALLREGEEVPEPLAAALLGRGDRPRERYPVLSAFRQLFVRDAPLLLLLDDLQHADRASLDLLEYLVRNTLELERLPFLYVLSEEPGPSQDDGLSARLAATGVLHAEALGPLACAEVEELVLSLVPEADLARPLALRLHAESEGSPAYLVDMLRGLADEGLLVQEGDRWRLTLAPEEITESHLPMPASLRQALLDRLAPLSAGARALGSTLAVARRPMDLDVLIEVADEDEDHVMDALDELVAAGIAFEDRAEGREHVGLSHQRFREVLLEEVPEPELARHHQRTGEVLERAHRHRTALVAEELTYHFEQAGLITKAYAYLLHTARRRLDASLWDEALLFLDRAMAMEPDARAHLVLEEADRHLAEIRLGRSRCLAALGRWEAATVEAERAAGLAEDVQDPVLESQVLMEVGRQYRQQGMLLHARPWLVGALDRAEDSPDPSLRTGPLYELGALAWASGDLEGARRRWRETLETAQQVGDERAAGFGYNGLGILAICGGHTMDARRHLEHSARVFERLGMLAPLSIARLNLSELYHATGLLRKAVALAELTIAQAREVHHPLGIALGLAHRARVLLELARRDEALHDATQSVHLAAGMHVGEDELLTRATLARVHLDRDEPAAALAVLEELAPLLERFDTEGIAAMVTAWRATALARQGRHEDALVALTLAGSEEPPWPHVRVRTELAAAEAHTELGRPEAAREPLQRALQIAEASGYRFYQLHAHQGLSRVVPDGATRSRHARVASALARSLAANLTREDGQRFLARGWGAA